MAQSDTPQTGRSTDDHATTPAEYSIVDAGTTIFQLVDGTYVEWYVVDLIWREAGVSAILSRGVARATVDADTLAQKVADEVDHSWVPAMYDGTDEDGQAVWVPHPRRADPDADADDVDLRVAPDNPSELTFEKIEGAGSRKEVNNFLEGASDGLVFHELGGVSSWKAAFVARYDGAIVSAIVLHHYHPSTNGEELAITRLANHASAPANTSTWMIARARDWAERAGYDRLATYAGVGGNSGTCYRAAGFEAVGEPEVVTGKSWTGSREEEWRKQKFVYDLEPETYEDKSDQWAIETVADSVVVPGRTPVC